MKKNIYADCVYEFENFLSIDQQNTLIMLAESLGDNWDNGTEGYWKDKNGKIDNPIMDVINSNVQGLFNNSIHINQIDAINRFRSGDDMGLHSDEVGHEQIQYGVVIYINDDFLGGEICYPTLNLIHKPKARSLIVHPGNLPHSVNTIGDGPVRYSITTFVHGSKDNPVEII
jgi:hypothetical protein